MATAAIPSAQTNGTNGTTSPLDPKTPPPTNPIVPNLDVPDNHFTIFQKSLLEHEFEAEDAFVSAQLSRLQHGIYQDDRVDMYDRPSKRLNVTFVAITFVFHPMYSIKKRFKRAQISVQAFEASGKPAKASYVQPLKISMFAPHVAYGRISTESLLWKFTLGANLGVTNTATGLESPSVNPSAERDETKVLGAMMKIQGSTRTAGKVQSSKLVWSLEENDQQSTGLPREFTFVFLVEQPVAKAPFTLQIGIKPVISQDLPRRMYAYLTKQPEIMSQSGILAEEVGQKFSCSPFNFATMKGQLQDMLELPGIANTISDVPAVVAANTAPTAGATPATADIIIGAIKKDFHYLKEE